MFIFHKQSRILFSCLRQSLRSTNARTLSQCPDSWDVNTVAHNLEKKCLYGAARIFREHKIDGKHMNCGTADLLGHLHGKNEIQLEELKKYLNDFQPIQSTKPEVQPKVFNDPVHGHIVMHPLCVSIMDTPQFQRLRYLQQMGTTHFVYPGGVHSRFAHSLGVCYLAGILVERLKQLHSDKDGIVISDEDVLCVKIAGLCHDLGHGPFSHLFENRLLPEVGNSTWEHEKGSKDMLDHMFRDPTNYLVTKFRSYGLTARDYKFIKEQIAPKKINRREGRTKEKSFLYEIVANRRNGVDVDKWDYIARDCHHLGMRTSFDHMRSIHFARVVKVNDEAQICLRDKEAYNMYEMFRMRHSLHRWVCFHRVKSAIDLMLVEAMKKANSFVQIRGKDGELKTIAECVDDMDAYLLLTDSIFHQILNTREENVPPSETINLQKAKDILQSIQHRQLYRFLFESQPLICSKYSNETQAKEDLLQCLTDNEKESLNDCFFVELITLDFGRKDQNPLLDLYFYSKSDPKMARRLEPDQVSMLVPKKLFCEQIVRVFTKRDINESQKELLKKAIEDFNARNNREKSDVIVEQLSVFSEQLLIERVLTGARQKSVLRMFFTDDLEVFINLTDNYPSRLISLKGNSHQLM